jgi:hypothetical protein
MHESDGYYGEVSPAAFALRKNIPKSAIVLHQVRNPIESVNSLFYTAHCRWHSDGTIHANAGWSQRAWDLLYLRSLRDVQWSPDRMRRCAQFWQAYNKRISQFVTERKGWRYRVEDVNAELIKRIFDAVGQPHDKYDDARIEDVIANTSKMINRLKREPACVFDWEHMTRNQITQAANYGYTRSAA